MANLYVWVDDRNRERVLRTVGDLARRHPQFRDFLSGGDSIEGVLNLLFPHGMPMEYHGANLSIENRPDDNLNLALRPVINPEQPWPFPRGCSLAVRGFWPTRVPSPVFMVQDLFEVADAPGHSYERSLSVVVYQDNPQLPRIAVRSSAIDVWLFAPIRRARASDSALKANCLANGSAQRITSSWFSVKLHHQNNQ